MKKNGNSSRSSSASSSSGAELSRYKRIKLDSGSEEVEGSPSSTELVTTPPVNTNPKTQAAFVNKLYKMLEDPDTSDLIAWSSLGDLFSVSNPTAFSKTVLPLYFKHNNWQSFVRQLNMYGFHKVNDLVHSNLTNESQTWEFKHPNFRRGAVGDLQHIKRKSPKSQQVLLQQQRQQQQQAQQFAQQQAAQQQADQQHQDMTDMYTEDQNKSDTIIKYIQRIEHHLSGVSSSCEQLFNEVVHLRMVVSKQQDAMQDLVDVVSSMSKNNCCQCNNTNNQELQNAENLRLQVSKLKSNQNNSNRYDTNSPSGQRNSNNNTNNEFRNTITRNTFASSSASSSSFDSNEKNKSAMGFGKQSHMLNPVEGPFTRQRNGKNKR